MYQHVLRNDECAVAKLFAVSGSCSFTSCALVSTVVGSIPFLDHDDHVL